MTLKGSLLRIITLVYPGRIHYSDNTYLSIFLHRPYIFVRSYSGSIYSSDPAQALYIYPILLRILHYIFIQSCMGYCTTIGFQHSPWRINFIDNSNPIYSCMIKLLNLFLASLGNYLVSISAKLNIVFTLCTHMIPEATHYLTRWKKIELCFFFNVKWAKAEFL